MEESQFEIGEFQGIPMVTVHGDVDMHSAPDFRSAVDRAQGTHGLVIVDLRDCQFMDSSGLTVMIHIRKAVGRSYPVVVQSDAYLRRLFKMTGIDAVCDLCEDTNALRLLTDSAG